MGMMPIVIPAFWKTLKAMKAKRPVQIRRPKVSRATTAGVQHPPGDHAEEGEHADGADEAELLGHGGEDEVGLLLGHVAEIRLRPVPDARAEEAARADGVLGLLRVVDGRLHVGVGAVRVRVQERRQPGDLVVVQQAALDGHQGDERGADRAA